MEEDCNLRSVLKSEVISLTSLWKCDNAWSESVSPLHADSGLRFTPGLFVGDVLMVV
jgi:hypothetical protein